MLLTHDDRVSAFADSIANVTRMLSRSIYAPYIEFNIGDWKISTHKNNNYFMQLNITYTGAGSANTTGIELAYIPKPGQDPNYIDEVLDGAVANKKSCYLRFGYSGNELLLSPVYEVILTDYKVSLRDNMIYYSISCISTIAEYRELRTSFPLNKIVNYQVSDNGIIEDASNTNPVRHIKRTIEKYFADRSENWVVQYADSDLESYAKPIHLKLVDDVTLFQYIDTILAQIQDTESEGAIYWYDITDLADGKQLTLHRTVNDLTAVSSNARNKLESLFTFDWGGDPRNVKHNTLVMAFENSFTGAVNIATTSEISQDRFVINSSGQMVKINSPKSVDVGDYAELDTTESLKLWSKANAWVYDAQLELLGIPADIPIGVLIRVRPLFYGQEHHTSGLYMITGASSNITSGGFTTNLKLVKYIDYDARMALVSKMIRTKAAETQALRSEGMKNVKYGSDVRQTNVNREYDTESILRDAEQTQQARDSGMSNVRYGTSSKANVVNGKVVEEPTSNTTTKRWEPVEERPNRVINSDINSRYRRGD